MKTYVRGFDPLTLRETVDLAAVESRLAELGAERSLSALGERTDLLRSAGRLDEALEVANEAVKQARFDGERERLVKARIRHAIVIQFQGKLDAAIAELDECASEANGAGWTETEGYALEHRGKAHFEQDRLDEAARDLNDSLIIRIRDHASPDLVDGTMFALGVVLSLSDSRGS